MGQQLALKSALCLEEARVANVLQGFLMRAITMTVVEGTAILDGENKWFLRHRGSDILPPTVRELVAIHSSTDFPDYVVPLHTGWSSPATSLPSPKPETGSTADKETMS